MSSVTSTRARSLGPLLLLFLAVAPFSMCALAETTPASGTAATEASPVSATGLLPVFGVAVDLDAGKPDQAVTALSKLWDEYLKEAGFNVIQFPIDVRELGDRGAGRLAKLCVWAKANNLRLAPILVGAPVGEALPGDYAEKAGAFAAKTIELVGKEDPQAYAQIMLYQLERPLNHPGNHGPSDASATATMLQQVLEKVRASEQTGLAGSSLQATPMLASASFDYELIRNGAIAHVAITDEAYQQAYASLRGYLTTVLGQAPIDVIQIEWHPGSYSSDAVDRMPDLITKLQADFPGKLLVMGTGYSTAAGADGDQSKYYTQVFNNLSDLRTNQGVESSLAGILWRTALDRPGGEPSPPSSKTLEEMPNWNWTERAAEVTRMWNEPGADSKEMRWWLGRVESRFGLITTARGGSKPGEPKATHQLLARLKSSLVAAAQATGAGDIAKELTTEGGGKGIGGAVKERLQAALFGMLDAWVAKTAENLVSGGSNEGAPPPPPSSPAPSLADLQILGIGEIPAAPKVAVLTPLPVTVFNAGSVPATNVVLYLRTGGSTDLASSSPTTLSPGASSTVELPWTPTHPGNIHDVSIDAYCDNEGDPTTNKAVVGDVPVEPASGGGGSPGGGKGGIKGGIIYNPAILGGVKGALTTTTASGFVRIESIRSMTPVMMSMSAPAPGGISAGGAAIPRSGSAAGAVPRSGSVGGAGAVPRSATTGPEAVSLAFSISNPFGHNFTQVSAVLKIEGKTIATKQLGTLYPHQRRTVSFAQWTPPRAGTFPVIIDLKGTGPTGVVLLSTAKDQIVIPSGGRSGTQTRSFAMTSAGGATGGGGSGAMTQTRLITPLLISSSSPQIGKTPQPRPLYLVPGSTRPVAGLATLFGLTANSLVLEPFPATVGQDVELSVRLFNSDRLAAKKVKVEGFVDGDKLGETTIEVPIAKAVFAKGFTKWKAKPGRHSFRAVVTQGDRTASATKPIDVRPPKGIGAGGVASLLGRGALSAPKLAITSTDIRLIPLMPAAGAEVTLSVRLQNVGGGAAKGARAELFADGVRLGEATADIAAGGEAILTSFPRWKPTAGNHTLLCRATLAGVTTEAKRDVSVGGTTLAIKAPLATATRLGGFAMLTTAKPDLQILPGDITFSPAMPKAGSALTISITVRNLGSVAATGGTVVGILTVDGAEATRSQFAAALAPSGATTLSWQVTTPNGKQLAVRAAASVPNDAQTANNEATAMTSVAAILVKPVQPYLQIK